MKKFTHYKCRWTAKIETTIDLEKNQNGEYYLITHDNEFALRVNLLKNDGSIRLYDENDNEFIIEDCQIKESNINQNDTIYKLSFRHLHNKDLKDCKCIRNIKVSYRTNGGRPYIKSGYISHDDEQFKISIKRLGNSNSINFSIELINVMPYHDLRKLIIKIRGFLCCIEAVKFYETDIQYMLDNGKILEDFYESTNIEPGSPFFFRFPMKKYFARFQCDEQKTNELFGFWLSKVNDEKWYKLSRVIEFFHRGNFANPPMYFKDIFSYLEEVIKELTGTQKVYDETLKKRIYEVIDEQEIEKTEKNKLKDKANLFSSTTTKTALRKFFEKDGILLKIKPAKFEELATLRDNLTHYPLKNFEVDGNQLLAWVIIARELLINILFIEYFVNHVEFLKNYEEKLVYMIGSYWSDFPNHVEIQGSKKISNEATK